MKSSDCVYYLQGNCAKALPNVECERKGCVAYQQCCDEQKRIMIDSMLDDAELVVKANADALCDYWEYLSKDNASKFIDMDQHISLSHLQDILAQCVEVGYINEYSMHRIMDLVKKEI